MNQLINIYIQLRINMVYKILLESIHNQQRLVQYYQKMLNNFKDHKILSLIKNYKIIIVTKTNKVIVLINKNLRQ